MERGDLGTDLQLVQRSRFSGTLDLMVAGGDLVPVSGLDNLAQAIQLRLSVPLGDLAHLGHPDFGSRLYLLVGRLPTSGTLALAKAYVREALRKEPRIADVSDVDVQLHPTTPGILQISLGVRPVGEATPVPVSINFALEPGQAGGELA